MVLIFKMFQLPQHNHSFVTGYILVGGRGRRLGQAKPLTLFKGKELWQIPARLLYSALCKPPVLVGDFTSGHLNPKLKRLPDALAGKGPLGGLVAILQDCPTPWALVLPVDLPNFSLIEVANLIGNINYGTQAITFGRGKTLEPLGALYHRDSLPIWERRLINDELGLQDGIHQLKFEQLPMLPDCSAFLNLNTPADLSEAASTTVQENSRRTKIFTGMNNLCIAAIHGS
jgi:molybdopterin-guanine dinucleotide biosynthesis protein A